MFTSFYGILPLLLFLMLVIWFVWFRRTESTSVFKIEWRTLLSDKVKFYRQLSKRDKDRFEKEIVYFLDHVAITGVDVAITDEDRLLVASSAVIPLFGFIGLRYRNINEVLLYKARFNSDNQTEGEDRNILGKVGSGEMNRLMILSLPALRSGFENENSTSNVGIHEFVHLIDKADGATDGLPESLMQKQYVLPWLKAMHSEIEKIKSHKSDINPYGATSEIEFLSVASEYFFNQPKKFQENHPKLYDLMVEMYKQNL
ncbi:zinc-dependent peptidase [Maribacter sp. X9]|uniref:M90 family metallopeptidase n=1 Tax=Maribacter sp. X9 TaxID=3402159 RepID=UPI003AF34C92